MNTAAVTADFDGTQCRVVNLDHLLALKLHVLRLGLAHRTNKDAEDVEELIRRNRLPLDSNTTATRFSPMATPNSSRPSVESSGRPEAGPAAPDRLDLPEDPGFRPAAPQVSLRVLLERCEDLRRWLPHGLPTPADRLRTKCDREFVL